MDDKVDAGEQVVLVHGLWLWRISLAPLQRRLEGRGWSCRRFSYPTVRRDPITSAGDLADFSKRLECNRLHWVGHSLGGLLVLAMLAQFSSRLPPGRAVLLGSPAHGSMVVRRMTTMRGMRTLIGRSARTLNAGFEKAPDDREIGMIAGTAGVGAGRLIADLDKPHDGTIAVSETRLQGLADHLQLPVSHSGLLLSGSVARAISSFLVDGRFTATRPAQTRRSSRR